MPSASGKARDSTFTTDRCLVKDAYLLYNTVAVLIGGIGSLSSPSDIMALNILRNVLSVDVANRFRVLDRFGLCFLRIALVSEAS